MQSFETFIIRIVTFYYNLERCYTFFLVFKKTIYLRLCYSTFIPLKP